MTKYVLILLTVFLSLVPQPLRADFNGDGKADLVWKHKTTGTVAVWYMNGTTMTSSAVLGTVGADWQLVGTPDLNSDGKSDLLWRHTSTGTIAYWIMNGATVTSTGTIGTVPTDWRIAGTADLNADGKADILWQHTPTGAVAVWYMNGTAVSSSAVITGVGTDWQMTGTADLNADGKPDILWRQVSTGLVAYWLMNGSTITAGGGIATAPSNWRIVGAPDLNSDGKADILWRETTTGAMAVWTMNGTGISSSAMIGTVDPNWELVGVGLATSPACNCIDITGTWYTYEYIGQTNCDTSGIATSWSKRYVIAQNCCTLSVQSWEGSIYQGTYTGSIDSNRKLIWSGSWLEYGGTVTVNYLSVYIAASGSQLQAGSTASFSFSEPGYSCTGVLNVSGYR